VPIEIINDYESRVPKLKRKVLRERFEGHEMTFYKEDQTYAEAKEESGKNDMPFRGKAEAVRRAFASAQPR
jgi:hypothetical protein